MTSLSPHSSSPAVSRLSAPVAGELRGRAAQNVCLRTFWNGQLQRRPTGVEKRPQFDWQFIIMCSCDTAMDAATAELRETGEIDAAGRAPPRAAERVSVCCAYLLL